MVHGSGPKHHAEPEEYGALYALLLAAGQVRPKRWKAGRKKHFPLFAGLGGKTELTLVAQNIVPKAQTSINSEFADIHSYRKRTK